MSSAPLLERRVAATGALGTRELLVLWQHPETREIIPIGRLIHEGTTYSFSYTRAAAGVEDFRPLPGLEELHERYVSSKLPAVFGLRVMDPDRPDYEAYVRTLGLDPREASPWEQIVHSGGHRAGDTLQFMPLPTTTDGRAQARFLVNGIRHVPDEAPALNGRTIRLTEEQHDRALRGLASGDTVMVEPEQANPRDPYATLVTSDGVPLGWVPRVLAPAVRELRSTAPLTLTVRRVGDPGTPPHLRLDVELDVTAPDDFAFDREGRWEPLPTS